MAESVKVIVRCRPMNSREMALKCKSVVVMDNERCTCSIINPDDGSAPPKTFTFDGVYSTNSTTEQIYNEIAYPLIESALEGYNSTIFAYGQTGCGKSFSMQGVSDPPSQRGVIPRAFEHIFEAIAVTQNVKYLVLGSYLEIYNEEIRDLLGTEIKRKLELKECPARGVYVQDLTWHAVGSVADCEALMSRGWSNRSVGATLMNADSSRSHSIFSISIEMMKTSGNNNDGLFRKGKLSLVDLAGSERQTKTGAHGERLKEASKINLSLSALGNVISALVDGKAKHIPYRDSKLTRLLQDSLGGNTKTLMLACLSPADNNYDETLSTLRYANRAKNICNKPHINEDPKDAMLRRYQEEIEELKAMLTTPKMTAVDEVLLQQEREKVRLEYEKELAALREQFTEMHMSKIQVESEFDSLKNQYENQLNNINKKSMFKQENITIVDGGSECKEERTDQDPAEDSSKSNEAPKLSQQEILARLVKLQRTLVGGEKAGDQDMKDRRAKRKKAAEQRLNALAEVLAKEEHSNLVLGVYDDMHDQLTARSETLKKYRHKIKSLEREISDLQSEFEVERTDYLETIRRLNRQVDLHCQIIEKILPALKNQYNYSNIEQIKTDALWDDESNRWILPDLNQLRTKLPPPGTSWRLPSQTAPGRLQASLDSSLDPFSQKLEKSEEEDFAGNYFKPKRATELLIKAQQDVAKANNFNVYTSKGINLQSSLNSYSSLKNHKSTYLNNSWSGSHSNISGWIDSPTKRPVRLEALSLADRKPTTKPQLNTLDVI